MTRSTAAPGVGRRARALKGTVIPEDEYPTASIARRSLTVVRTGSQRTDSTPPTYTWAIKRVLKVFCDVRSRESGRGRLRGEPTCPAREQRHRRTACPHGC